MPEPEPILSASHDERQDVSGGSEIVLLVDDQDHGAATHSARAAI
jgi:hypothetical protein